MHAQTNAHSCTMQSLRNQDKPKYSVIFTA
uniref:Uncharacterized protein n=1 Tax=Rhizophora mucronata TaxID=61149 RepID=A0A2P2PXI3_RHIMU